MFGYASPAPAPVLKDVVSNAVKAARAEPKPERKIQSIPNSQDYTKQMESRTPPKTEKPMPSLPPSRSLPAQPVPLPLLDKEKPAIRNPVTQGKSKTTKVAKPSISSLDDIMDLLENEALVPKQAQSSSRTEREKAPTRVSIGKGAGKKEKAGKPSISSLDEMMSMLEQDWDVGSSDRKELVPNTNASQTTVEQVSNGLQAYTEGDEDESLTTEPLSYVEEAGGVRVNGETKSSAYRKDSVASSSSFAPSEPKSFVDTLDETQPQIGEEGNESSEKPILDYMKEAEEMRLERERMEFERQKFLEEELAFQREADRFAEEEEKMRRFVENLKREEEVDFENQERKRQIAEEKRRAEEAERKRLQDLEDERLAIEMAERLNMENDRIEKERRERERIYQERVDLERARYVEEEARLREQRMEDARIAREEDESEERLRYEEEEARLEARRIEDEEIAERERRAVEESAERERYEKEEAQREQIARGKRRAAKQKAERLRYEEEEAQRGFQRREAERIAQERRRVERQRVERMRYQEEQEAQRREDERMQRQNFEQEDSEPQVLTKEQELAKAEEKIRAAFAGLAQERDQLAKGVQPVGKGSRVENGLDVGVERERGVSRYNTVAGARPRQENPMGVSRGNTVGVRPNKSIGGGLPSGPKAGGFGLPAGPRAGLPSGPRPRGRI